MILSLMLFQMLLRGSPMIKLIKTSKPQILEDNATLWTTEYMTCIHANQTPSDTVAHRYNHPEIKTALGIETHGKCAYCESKIKHIEFGDIEHIIPKNKNCRPDLYVEWNNLTLACEKCNRTNKKDYYDPQMPLINPYIDDPENFFVFLGPLISAKDNNTRGFVTEETLKLNRSELIERRMERLQHIEMLLYSWSNEANPTIKKILSDELKEECAPDKEYSAVVKHFLIAKGFPEDELV